MASRAGVEEMTRTLVAVRIQPADQQLKNNALSKTEVNLQISSPEQVRSPRCQSTGLLPAHRVDLT